jgi:hypothetical protein
MVKSVKPSSVVSAVSRPGIAANAAPPTMKARLERIIDLPVPIRPLVIASPNHNDLRLFQSQVGTMAPIP